MRGWKIAFEPCLSSCRRGSVKASPWSARILANTKAAYRFLSNERVSEEALLAGHFQSTRERCLAEPGPVLVLHDTTEFSFKREDIAPIGMLKKGVAGQDRHGRLRHYTSCGLLMHASLAVTPEGLPLGLAAVKFWTRKKFKGTNALRGKVNPTRVPIEQKESVRWLRTCGRPRPCCRTLPSACTSGIVKATFTSFSRRPTTWAPLFWCAPAWSGGPARATTPWPRR
jgi:hypothetical protein